MLSPENRQVLEYVHCSPTKNSTYKQLKHRGKTTIPEFRIQNNIYTTRDQEQSLL